jgi:hypothetical protein
MLLKLLSWFEDFIQGKKYNSKQYSISIFCLAFAFYANTFSNGYSLDDHLVTLNHQYVNKGISGIADILTSFYIQKDFKMGEYRPISQISFAIEYEFFGKNPNVSHFFNAVYYGVLCILLFQLLLKVFPKNNFSFILLGVVFFVIHPIHTEVVASLKNRENIFSMLWGLVACLYFVKYLEHNKLSCLIGVVFFFLLGLLSKIDAVVFIPLIILIGFFKQAKWIQSIPIACILIVVYFTRNILLDIFLPPTPPMDISRYFESPINFDSPFIDRLLFAPVTLLYYLKLLIFPYPLRLYYGFNMIPMPQIFDVRLWLSLIIYSALTGVAIWQIQKRTFLSFSILWYLISISIFAQIVEPVTGIIAERHAFIASAGFTMLLSFLLVTGCELLTKYKIDGRKILVSFVILLIAVCFVYVQQRNREWKTGDTLIDADIPKLQNSVYAHYEYANNLSHRADMASTKEEFHGYVSKAIGEFMITIDMFPKFTTAWYNAGISYLRIDSTNQAYNCFYNAWKIDSTIRSANYFLGLQAVAQGDTSKAIDYYERELRYRPENIRAIERYYDLCVPTRQIDRAISTFHSIAEKKALNSRVYYGLGNLYAIKGDTAKAKFWFDYSRSPYVKNEVEFTW